jgi:hypothetical protein
VLKDLAWTSGNVEMGKIAGSIAMSWCGLLFAAAAYERHWEECYNLVAVTLWLFGNYWWMAGEEKYIAGHTDDATNALQSSYILEAGIAHRVLLSVFESSRRFCNRRGAAKEVRGAGLEAAYSFPV